MGGPPKTTCEAQRFSLALLIVTVGACFAAVIYLSTGHLGLVGLSFVVLMDLPVAAGIFVAAGGWGWLALRRMLPPDTPASLAAVTCIAFGLWLLSTATVIAGSVASGMLTPEIAWPVIGIGVSAAAWALRTRILAAKIPRRIPVAALFWVVAAMAAALWLAGASMPAGTIGLVNADFYDVVSYHLQIPGEFIDTGRITDLQHNTYSHYPLGGEMLFLLSMCLKGGASAGAFTAKFTHGLWGVLAAATVYAAMPDTWRRRAAAAMLVSTPLVLYLSWLGFVELSELAYLAVAVAWLRHWVFRPTFRAAAMIGLAAGGACAAKYLSVGLVAAPVLVAMLPATHLRGRRIAQVLVAGGICLVLMSPWLIRNAVYTGNPVFPLATDVFGAGHWTAEQVARWDAGHAPAPWADKLSLLGPPFLSAQGFGPFVSLMTLAAIPFVVAPAIPFVVARGRRGDPTDWICIGILAVQVLVWALATHMPARFLAPSAIPLCILAGGLCSQIARRAQPDGPPTRRFIPILGVAVIVAAGFAMTADLYLAEQNAAAGGRGLSDLHGQYPEDMARMRRSNPIHAQLTPGSRLLMVGDAMAFNYPRGTLYATAWEADLLVRITQETTDPREIVRRLRAAGVTHLLVNWSEIDRLQRTYGWWDTVTGELVDSLLTAGAVKVPLAPPVWYNGRPVVDVEMLVLP